ncbi:Degradation activator [Sebaldella termitidis]|uniref:Transcriptional regulator, LacI family n=1 Tax=Sebaldella termitidis (strain ATCC 33386 / NCTC 11300) TaxID=526218 RepID=D1ANT7_SEBTE|nr:LacI family DNA-binding transcriptional regulator [Sebaldella termitidis]ACZ09891.1 transcriptional regulator, LacI family [Sebaldella termitidis ATCC 33386]SUI25223.1 Degradation activator [Sebaldella termitidis]
MSVKGKLSIKDIAKRAGVSIATVSRVLNKNGRYSRETEEKILKIIEESGYRRNVNAKSLRTKKTQTIGVIVPDITNEFFAKIIQSVERNAMKYDYSVFVCNTDEDEAREQMQVKNLLEKFVDGIIYISGKTKSGEEVEENIGIPVVYIDRYISASKMYVQSDNKEGGYLATKELLSAGCENIMIIKDFRQISSIISRYEGYKMALKEAGKSVDENLIHNVDHVNYEEAKKGVLEKINNGIKFDGIFATNDWMAIGAISALREREIKIPEEVKIVGFDNMSISEITSPSITTIHQDSEKLGEYATEILMGIILKDETDVKNISVPVKLVKRNSTKNK